MANELVLFNQAHKIARSESLNFSNTTHVSKRQYRRHSGTRHCCPVLLYCTRKSIQTRNDLAVRRAEFFRKCVPPIVKHNPETRLLIVTNLVAVMISVAWKLTRFPSNRHVGTRTLTDSIRYRTESSDESEIHPNVIPAYILAGHGDSQFPALSLTLW